MSATFLYPDAIVSASWLADNLDDPNLRVFECTMYLKYDVNHDPRVWSENARPDFDAGHIPGAAYLDLQADLSDNESPYRFTMPGGEALAATLGNAGLGDGNRAVLYSRDTLQWSTRVWWMLRAIGFDNAAVLNGGFNTWAAEGRAVSTEPATYAPATLTAKPRPELFVGRDGVQDAIGAQGVCTINALTPDLHSGENPRYGRPGRIPGSVNVPASSLQDAKSLLLKPLDEMAGAFADAGADKDKRTIVYCGGGIAATLDAFVLHQLGFADITVYDNSMTEWANDESVPMETD